MIRKVGNIQTQTSKDERKDSNPSLLVNDQWHLGKKLQSYELHKPAANKSENKDDYELYHLYLYVA